MIKINLSHEGEFVFWAIFLGIIWSQIISHFAVSIGLHRYFSHRQIEASPATEWVMIFMILIACVRTPIGWIASHRMHHEFTDTKDDPHSPKHVGFWKVLFTTWELSYIPPKYARDLYQNPRLAWAHKYWKHFLLSTWLITFLIDYRVFIGFSLIPFLLARLGFGLLNTVGHIDYGGSNKPWLNFIIAGEGYHKNHHINSKQIRLHKYDIGGIIAEKFFRPAKRKS